MTFSDSWNCRIEETNRSEAWISLRRLVNAVTVLVGLEILMFLKGEHLLQRKAENISYLGGGKISYVIHEFEALIFSDPQKLDWEYLEQDRPISNLKAIVEGKNPELIDDGPTTAPSKRILAEIPEYDKVTAGVSVAGRIGLQTIRQKCQHFNEWLTGLEQLALHVPR